MVPRQRQWLKEYEEGERRQMREEKARIYILHIGCASRMIHLEKCFFIFVSFEMKKKKNWMNDLYINIRDRFLKG